MRFLDHLQIFYLLFLGLASSTSIFSGYLDESWVLFPRNFYIFCTTGDLVCTVGFPLSFTSCLIGFLLIVKIIVAIEQCRKKELRFEPVYLLIWILSVYKYINPYNCRIFKYSIRIIK